MPNIATVFKQEITRLARKEVRAQTGGSKKAAAQYRRDIAALKRQVRDLTKEVTYLRRQESKRAENTVPDGASSVRFSPSWVEAHREKLELSAADYAELVGVSGQTIYNWEKGKTKPHKEQLAAWAGIRSLGKREAWKRLELMEG